MLYYHETRIHIALDDNAPLPRQVEAPEKDKVVALPVVGGLPHGYRRVA